MSQTVADKSAEPAPSHAFLRNNPATVLWRSMVGKKIVMALTGLIMVGFIIGHVAGNLHVFQGSDSMKEYAVFLREVGHPIFGPSQLLWGARIVLLLSVILHIVAAVQLTMMNMAARPQNYEKRKSLKTGIAALTMQYSGVLVALFIVFHILHLTLGAVGFSGDQFKGHEGVYGNVILAFQNPYIAVFYIVAVGGVSLHLYHGIWSMLQTLGLNNKRTNCTLKWVSRVVAVGVFVGFVAVPVSIVAGWVS